MAGTTDYGTIIMGIILFIAVVIAGVYLTIIVSRIVVVTSDDNTAYILLLIAAIVTWVIVGFIVLYAVYRLVRGVQSGQISSMIPSSAASIATAALGFTFVLNGTLALIAAYFIANSTTVANYQYFRNAMLIGISFTFAGMLYLLYRYLSETRRLSALFRAATAAVSYAPQGSFAQAPFAQAQVQRALPQGVPGLPPALAALAAQQSAQAQAAQAQAAQASIGANLNSDQIAQIIRQNPQLIQQFLNRT